MSDPALMEEVMNIINANSNRIRAVSASEFRTVFIKSPGGYSPLVCRHLVLRQSLQNSDRRKTVRFFIPDFEVVLAKESVAPSKEPCELTRFDVEKIILEASHNRVHLMLQSYHIGRQ